MKIKKAYKFRIKPNPAITEKFVLFADHCRWVWNEVFKINKLRLQNGHRIMRYHEMDFWSKLWKQSEEHGFLSQCSNGETIEPIHSFRISSNLNCY